MNKKFILTLFSLVLVVGLVIAAQGYGTNAQGGSLDSAQGSKNEDGSGNAIATNTNLDTSNQGDNNQLQNRVQEKIQSGKYENAEGKQIQVQTKSNNRLELKSGNSIAETDLEIEASTENGKTSFKAKLSNGKNAEVKVMPDTASEKALERLRLKICSEEKGCSIELKEVSSGEKAKLAYEVKTQRTSRFLGMFKTQMNVEAQVDAESGEVIRTKKPWWAFLASEPEE